MVRKQQKPLQAKITEGHPFYRLIQETYRVFAYPKPTSLGVCEGCCMYPEIERDFFTPDITELPLHYLQDWYFAACDPSGVSKAIWGYLLPRVLEVLSVDEDVASVGKEVSLNRFKTGMPDAWSQAEWSILDRFQRAYLDREARRQEEYLDDTLCMFALGGWPLTDLLGQVSALPDDVLARRLWHDWCDCRNPGIWIDAFWKEEAIQPVTAFYQSQTLYDRMEALALADDTPAELASKASDVADVIYAARNPGMRK